MTTACASAPLPGGCELRLRDVVNRPAEVCDRIAQPLQLNVLTIDDVLIRVVEVVVGHEARARGVPLPQRGLVAIELAEQVEQG